MTVGAGRWWGPLCVVAFAACLMLGVGVSTGLTTGVDIAVSQALQTLHGSPLGALLETWERMGDLGVWLAVTLVIGLVMASGGRRMAGLWFLLAISADALASLLKLIFALPRPPGGELLGILGETSFAYPSGHVTRTLVLLGLLAWAAGLATPETRRATARTVLALGVAVGTVVMGAARVASGEHWASDVIGGALLGLAWLAGVVWLDGRIRAASAGGASTPSVPPPGP